MSKDKAKKTSDKKDEKIEPKVQAEEKLTEEKLAEEQETPELSPEEEFKKYEEENSFLKDQILRKTAEFENFRKRMFREKEEGIKYANSVLLTDIITIIDDFERAIQSASESRDFDSFHTGVAMIEKQMVSILEKNWGLKRFDSVEEAFDPEKHQAIAMEESDKYDESIVLEDYQKGYYLYDRVLRPARVKVSKPVLNEKSENNDSNEEEKE